MTLDEPCGGTREPEWMRLARLHEAEQREQERLEAEVRDACESVEGRESYWSGVMAKQPPWIRDAIYSSGPG